MKKSKKVFILLSTVALACAAGGGAVYYGFFMDQAERSAVADFVRSLIQDKVAPYAILALAAVLSVIECTRPWLTRISQAVARILTGQSAFESAARTAAGMESESRRAVEAMQAFEAAQEERAGRMDIDFPEAAGPVLADLRIAQQNYESARLAALQPGEPAQYARLEGKIQAHIRDILQ